MLVHTDHLRLDSRTGLPIATGRCVTDGCRRRARSFAYRSEGYAEHRDGIVPACRRHLLVYRVNAEGGRWQAEDEYAGLQYCRRSRWRWLAQWRLLLDQRAATRGRESTGQRRRRLRHTR